MKKTQKNTLNEFIFSTRGNTVPIVSADGASIVTSTAQAFVNTFTKLSYLLWLVVAAFFGRKPVEATPKSGTIAAGTLALNFNAAADIADVVGYEIFCGFSDTVAPGTINFSHTFDDIQKTASTFEFTIQPDFSQVGNKQSKIFYLASGGVGAKYYPMIHRCKFPVPVVGAATLETSNAFTVTGPNDVRVSILPVTSSSVHIYYLIKALPKVIYSAIAAMISRPSAVTAPIPAPK